MLSLLGPLWPHIRSCGSGDGLPSPPYWIILLVVLLHVTLAVRGADTSTVVVCTASLVISSMVLARLVTPARPDTASGPGR